MQGEKDAPVWERGLKFCEKVLVDAYLGRSRMGARFEIFVCLSAICRLT